MKNFHFFSPEGRKCRSKPQMMQYLPDNFDIDNFDFRGSSNADRLLKKRNKRKNGFNFGKEFNIPGNSTKPTRQTKKSRENIPISVLHTVNVENDRRKREVKRMSILFFHLVSIVKNQHYALCCCECYFS